jgi:integrase
MTGYKYKPKRSRIYRARIQLDGETRLSDVSLHTSDKQVAERRLSELIEQREKERGGLRTPKRAVDASKRALADHLADYVRELARLGRDDEYVYNVERLVSRLANECGWVTTQDVGADSFRAWGDLQKKSPKTLNEYLGSICGLLNWLVENGKLTENPLRSVRRIETRGREAWRRRALTEDEMRRILAASGEWLLVYLTALLTGLRRGELSKLRWEDLQFQAPQSFLTVQASVSKNRRVDTIPLHPQLARALQSARPVNNLPSDQVFPTMPRMDHHKAILAAAKVDYEDSVGRRADFHALRHTFDTNLAVAGIPERVRMLLMRHRTPHLTTETYTDVRLLPTAQAIGLLPWCRVQDSQIDSHELGGSGHSASQPVTMPAWLNSMQAVKDEEESHGEALPVIMGQSEGDGCLARTRT